MSGGWYKQLRNIPERAWFKDANVLLLYTYLKATAYVADGQYEGQIIRRGSCPTTRAEMMEATGLSYKQVDKCLKKLLSSGDIIVNGNNRFTIVTICDYDICGTSDGLFDAYEEQQRYSQGDNKGTAEGTTPPIYKKEERIYNNNLISHKCLIRRERDNNDVVHEIRKRYNREFDGILPPCLRLSTSAHIAVMECLRRFGLQSVDEVFAQIKNEKFSLGNNKTGFIANFTFIFTPKNYQQYLERAQLSHQKKEKAKQAYAINVEPQRTKEEFEKEREQERRKTLTELAKLAQKEPGRKTAWMSVLVSAYESGELASYGIDWKPNNIE